MDNIMDRTKMHLSTIDKENNDVYELTYKLERLIDDIHPDMDEGIFNNIMGQFDAVIDDIRSKCIDIEDETGFAQNDMMTLNRRLHHLRKLITMENKNECIEMMVYMDNNIFDEEGE